MGSSIGAPRKRLQARNNFVRVAMKPMVQRTLKRLSESGLKYAVTGSLALNARLCALGLPPVARGLNDIDIVVRSFAEIPVALRDCFMCIHAHPDAIDGKLLLQLADPVTRMRIDIFAFVGKTLSRSIAGLIDGRIERIVSAEDLAARATRSVLGLQHGSRVPQKIADDLLRMLPVLDYVQAEQAWIEHRGPDSEEPFQAAVARAQMLVLSHSRLLTNEAYATDIAATCARCCDDAGFNLTPKIDVLATLGYC